MSAGVASLYYRPCCQKPHCMVSTQHMYGLYTAHLWSQHSTCMVWSPHSTCMVSTRHMYVVHTIHVWCQHSTCVVSTKHMYGIHTCMVWTQHMCDVQKAYVTCQSHFLVVSRSFVHDFRDRLGYVWGHFGSGLGWIGDDFREMFRKS